MSAKDRAAAKDRDRDLAVEQLETIEEGTFEKIVASGSQPLPAWELKRERNLQTVEEFEKSLRARYPILNEPLTLALGADMPDYPLEKRAALAKIQEVYLALNSLRQKPGKLKQAAPLMEKLVSDALNTLGFISDTPKVT